MTPPPFPVRLSLLVLPLFLTACPDPGKDKAAAVVTEVPSAPSPSGMPPATGSEAAPATTSSDAPAASWIPATGTVGFHAAKVTRTHDALFGQSTLSVQMNGDQLTAVRVEVQVASVKTDTPKLDGHLQTPDFFDAANLPVATFTSTEIRAGAPVGTALAGATHTVAGDLTIHGVKKHIEVPAAVTTTATGLHAHTDFSVQRQDFGISYPGKADDLIADAVSISVDLAADRPAAAK